MLYDILQLNNNKFKEMVVRVTQYLRCKVQNCMGTTQDLVRIETKMIHRKEDMADFSQFL